MLGREDGNGGGVCLESKNKLERIGGLGGFSSVVMILELWMLL